ncbi:hypothetical protein FRX31_022822 [Thalictrum thalictroides]|uniref:Uncharacterized protein n=1 Tax=Thalictrum thalictroides TaxID=46969 RepID=A0A7J6VS55_THATH|nr:hypothetical protein FRX31_022822 [Thalictrum thalictroides]
MMNPSMSCKEDSFVSQGATYHEKGFDGQSFLGSLTYPPAFNEEDTKKESLVVKAKKWFKDKKMRIKKKLKKVEFVEFLDSMLDPCMFDYCNHQHKF